MINRPLQFLIEISGEGFQPLATAETLFTGDISCPQTNTEVVTFLIGDVEINWSPGEWHTFHHIDLRGVQVSGTSGDTVTCIGDSFAPQSAGGF